MRYRAKVCLERVEDVEGRASTVSHKIAAYEQRTPLAAFRQASSQVEGRWLNIAPLIEAGEKLTITVKPIT